MPHLLLGLDIGSSFVKATLVEAESGAPLARASAPSVEMPIASPQPGWAEQDPGDWWRSVVETTRDVVRRAGVDGSSVAAIGLSYQMHGLVVVDRRQRVLRPAIIWCDGRAVDVGRRAFDLIGHERCLARLLNSPGNFTASRLRWVKDHEPGLFASIDKAMLPGDYVAMRLTGRVATTASGLSEAVLWDFPERRLSDDALGAFELSPSLIPELVPTFGEQGVLAPAAAEALGLRAGTPLTFRAGDQPTSAFALNVLDPGEVAATAGTSGVVYGIGGSPGCDDRSRVNTFLHVTDRPDAPRYGVLLCVNGSGSLYGWLKRTIAQGLSYEEMDRLALEAPIGSDGLVVLPYGNGAERTLENADPGGAVLGLAFNRHSTSHLLRAAQEGIVFALNYGIDVMRGMGIAVTAVRAGRANLFLSELFSRAFADTSGAVVELVATDGAEGAARAAGVGAGIFPTTRDSLAGLGVCARYEPDPATASRYCAAYERWLDGLASVTGQASASSRRSPVSDRMPDTSCTTSSAPR
jgi:xylulokinase